MHAADAATRAPRHKTFLPGSVVVGAEPLRMHLLNVSRSGILAHCQTPLARDQIVLLDCGGLKRQARVVWAAGLRFGATFLQPLSIEETRQLAEMD